MPATQDRAVWGKWDPYMHSWSVTAHGFPAAAGRTQAEDNLTWPGQGQTAWLPAVFPLNQAHAGSLSIHVRAAQKITEGHTTHRPQAAKCLVSILKQTLARLSSWETWCLTTSKKKKKAHASDRTSEILSSSKMLLCGLFPSHIRRHFC